MGSKVVTLGVVAVLVAVIIKANLQDRSRRDAHEAAARSIAASGRLSTASTSRDGLKDTIGRMRERLANSPTDREAAVLYADALLRHARVSGNAGLAVAAEQALVAALKDEPLDYNARRMLATVYLSEHRFRDAIREAERARIERPTDDWNYGVLGDGHLELGEYEEAFAAFQRMMDLRPTAAAYARAAYALELRGRVGAALEAMKLSAEATAPTDAESLAWHHAQIGDLYRQMGRLDEAAREYGWADHSFPGHPFAEIGMAKVKEARGDRDGAIASYERLMASSPTPDVAERLGDLYAAAGRSADAARLYALAEAGWRVDAPQPAYLARFLATHDRSIDEAVHLAERAAAERQDIFTEDALAWCYFKAGRLAEASQAITRAQRTGTRDPLILAHAAAINRGSRS